MLTWSNLVGMASRRLPRLGKPLVAHETAMRLALGPSSMTCTCGVMPLSVRLAVKSCGSCGSSINMQQPEDVNTGVQIPSEVELSGLASTSGALPGSSESESLSCELLTLWKCQSILLEFSRQCRLQVHSAKNNATRLSVWSETSRVARQAEVQQQTQSQVNRMAVEKIRAQIPRTSACFSMTNEKIRLKNSQKNRRWLTKQTSKLAALVSQHLLTSLVELKIQRADDRADPRANVRADDRADEKTSSNYRDVLAEYESVTDDVLLQELEQLLRTPGGQEAGVEVSGFWVSFWERIAECIGGGRSGIECQIHWLHECHPGMNRQAEWSKEEESCLLALVDELGGGRWDEVADRLGTGRSAFSVFRHFQLALNPELTTADWSEEKTQQLVELVEKFKGDRSRMWRKIALELGQKTSEQCRLRYEKVARENVKAGTWSVEEDIKLQLLATIFGRGQWTKIADLMPGRTDVKCRERFENLLAPEVNKTAWTPEEDRRLLELVELHGPGNWAAIHAELGTGRTDAGCAKRWQKLDPLAAGKLGSARAAQLVFMPGQQKRRGVRASLAGEDFSLQVAEHLERIAQSAPEVKKPSAARAKLERSAFRKKTGYYLLKSDAGASGSSSQRSEASTPGGSSQGDSEPASSVVMEMLSVKERAGVRRLGLLRTYLQLLSTGKPEADRHLTRLKRLALVNKCYALAFPPEAADYYQLTGLENETLTNYVREGFLIDDELGGWTPETGPRLTSDDRLASEILQALSRAVGSKYDHEACQDVGP